MATFSGTISKSLDVVGSTADSLVSLLDVVNIGATYLHLQAQHWAEGHKVSIQMDSISQKQRAVLSQVNREVEIKRELAALDADDRARFDELMTSLA